MVWYVNYICVRVGGFLCVSGEVCCALCIAVSVVFQLHICGVFIVCNVSGGPNPSRLGGVSLGGCLGDRDRRGTEGEDEPLQGGRRQGLRAERRGQDSRRLPAGPREVVQRQVQGGDLVGRGAPQRLRVARVKIK